MYKRLLCSALAVLMVCTFFCASVSADTPSLENVCKDAYINSLKAEGATFEELTYFDYFGDGGCLVFQASALPGDPVEPQDVIGNYRFTAPMCMGYCDTNPAGMYAYNGGEVMTLREAYDEGLVDLDLLYENTDERYKMSPLDEEEILANKCRAEFMEEYGMSEDSYVDVCFAVKYDNYAVFYAEDGPYIPSERCFLADGYWFYIDSVADYYTLDNYGNVETLKETVNEGFIDLDEIFLTFSEGADMYLRGDIDSDKKLTIKDATLIQKYLAKIPEAIEKFNSQPLSFCVADADLSGVYDLDIHRDTDVNIKDATYIQKRVAKVIEDKDYQGFSDDCIIVTVNEKNAPEFTLEDFPECDIARIERRDYNFIEKTFFELYLENPGKENVIDAVNSLKYREGTDFDAVNPNYLDYIG